MYVFNFQFNDVLLYTNRTTTPVLQFKVHGQLPLRGVMVEETESRMGASNCFTIYGGNRCVDQTRHGGSSVRYDV